MNCFTAGADELELTNGGAAVFVDVLSLAVCDLAEDPWDYRFAAFVNLQDQSMMGRGVVGFDLEDIDWGPTPEHHARAKRFVLRVVELALTRHRWHELPYDPPFAQRYLRKFLSMLEAFTPAGAPRPDSLFPEPDEAACASCLRHRVLTGWPMWDGCVFCHQTFVSG